ncbi:pyruvate, phosphate dikinase [Patulibacter minatonensis]|uniref:pyruvate, phosphate dikinase n=1 Tax=Patulibacter minatonensis TaxID=298163 RepID=UPI0006850A6F|nr:pyruvate, phosphate dikinase [Patulibacter minatonensis]
MPATGTVWTHDIADPGTTDRAILGGKGAGLAEMVALGLPVPPAFVIGTPCGREHRATGALPASLRAEVDARIAALEAAAGRRFGDDADPLLVSVRSGAPVSMPGMMDTILNVGLTRAAAAQMSDARFATSSLERLLDGFARTVRGIGSGIVEDALLDLPPGAGAQERCDTLLGLIEQESGAPFPDARGQLTEAIAAVFSSWDSRRAKAYRRHKGIDDELGTAVVVQLMVFGNRDDRSGSGVGFTRDPSTGAAGAFGDFLFRAQGEDVVSGEHDTEPLTVIGERLPDVHAQLLDVFALLEQDARDLCDVEFTIESGRLHVLQTRVGQRSGRAAVRLAVELCDAGLIDRAEAIGRVDDEQLAAARAPVFADEHPEDVVLARGLAASPGAVVGLAAFDAGRAQALGDEGHDVILVRPTTSPVDLPGVIASVGVVTGRGGRTSHAAVVARGMGRAAVCGVGEVRVAADGRSAEVEGVPVTEGDVLSVDGDRGVVARGAAPRTPAEEDETLRRFMEWRAEAG